jgi:hypothetical protein
MLRCSSSCTKSERQARGESASSRRGATSSSALARSSRDGRAGQRQALGDTPPRACDPAWVRTHVRGRLAGRAAIGRASAQHDFRGRGAMASRRARRRVAREGRSAAAAARSRGNFVSRRARRARECSPGRLRRGLTAQKQCARPCGEWAILESNQGPLPHQERATIRSLAVGCGPAQLIEHSVRACGRQPADHG